jgi:hypothetical protein
MFNLLQQEIHHHQTRDPIPVSEESSIPNSKLTVAHGALIAHCHRKLSDVVNSVSIMASGLISEKWKRRRTYTLFT